MGICLLHYEMHGSSVSVAIALECLPKNELHVTHNLFLLQTSQHNIDILFFYRYVYIYSFDKDTSTE